MGKHLSAVCLFDLFTIVLHYFYLHILLYCLSPLSLLLFIFLCYPSLDLLQLSFSSSSLLTPKLLYQYLIACFLFAFLFAFVITLPSPYLLISTILLYYDLLWFFHWFSFHVSRVYPDEPVLHVFCSLCNITDYSRKPGRLHHRDALIL